MRNLCRVGQRPNYHETDEGLIPVFRKLRSQGITEEDEAKLLFLRESFSSCIELNPGAA